MGNLSKTSAISAGLHTAKKHAQGLGHKDGCKLTGAVFLVLIICLFGSAAFGQPWDGNGVEGDPYQIWTAADMQAIGADANYWDAHFQLMANINLGGYTGTSFNIIGSNPYWPTEGTAFTGVFNGNGHTISNFTYSSSGEGNIGVFGYVNGEIKNLGLINPNVNAGTGTSIGSLAGELIERGATISGCYVEGGSVSGNEEVGGLVGHNEYGVITNCYSSADVTGNEKVGGLAGRGGTISNSYASGSVSGADWVGGLCGLLGDMYNCYSTASVFGTGNYVGGLAGVSYAIMNCYSAGSVVGDSNAGGLVGRTSVLVVGSFWDIQTSGQSTSAGGTGLTTAEMKDANTYLYWGCGLAWTINAGVDYPRLWWENAPGEVLDAELSDFVAGAGTESEPYLIYMAEELSAIGLFWCEWDKHFKLMADIDLSAYTGASFNIIGTGWVNPFTGVFDGNGHTISNFSYSTTGTNNIGLFGYVREKDALIKDLGMVNPNIDAGTGEYVGSLVGTVMGGVAGTTITEGGRISGCFVEGGSVSGRRRVGGLIGEASRGTVVNCYSTATVSGDHQVGGLVGGSEAKISNCYSTGSVSGSSWVGGLVGNNYSGISTASHKGGTIMSCYARGSVSGTTGVGGLVGRNRAAEVCNSYSTGSVSGTTEVGGLVGSIEESTVTDSFWDMQTSGQATSAGGTGLTTAEMQDINTFLAAGWDFVGEYGNGPSDDWAEPPGGGYMIFWWQLSPWPALPTFSGGAGESNDPYLISTASELNRIGYNSRLMEAHFRLINDIDLVGIDFFFIGSPGSPYRGVFDGNGHTISNFTYTSTATDYIGVFGYVDGQDAEIKEVGLIDPNVDAGTGENVGSLVGWFADGTVSGCYVEGGSVSGGYQVGGLVGYIYFATVSTCYAAGSVSGGSYVGGLVGYNSFSTVSNCYVTGTVTGTEDCIGGLVGRNSGGTITDSNSGGSVSGNDWVGGLVGSGGTITNCYSTAGVFGNDYVGGLVGWGGTVTNCYATGDVSGGMYVGGLLGRNSGGRTVTNCYSKGDVTGGEDVGGLVGWNYDWAIISNCYSTGSASGATDVGGLVGENHDGAIIDNCYAHGDATGVLSVGGLVGKNSTYIDTYTGDRYYGTITNCYSVGAVTAFIGDTDIGGLVGLNDGQVRGSLWDAETSGRSNMCGSQGAEGSGCDDGNGKTTVQMQMASTFTAEGWDFVGESANGTDDFWDICEGTNYPKLVWAIPVGDFMCPDGVDGIDLGLLCEQWLYYEIPADVAPGGGDGIVNFFDWAIFADGWGVTVDIDDLVEFAEQWLKTGQNYVITDIAPAPDGDGVTNGIDFAALANNWLAGP